MIGNNEPKSAPGMPGDLNTGLYQIVDPLTALERSLRKRNRSITVSLLSVVAGLSTYFIADRFTTKGDVSFDITMTSLALVITGAGIGLYTYLQYTTATKLLAFSPAYPAQNAAAQAFGPPALANPLDPPGETQQSTPGASQTAASLNIIVINEDLQKMSNRIKAENARLSKSANVNLIFGSLNTVAAIIFLAIEVFGTSKLDVTKLPVVLAHYIPRLSLVIFIEIFAFFFLRIYKTNLNDIKYFHNEQTNIDQKLLALKIACISEKETEIQMVVKELAKAERNFVLKKNESTIQLEQDKLDVQQNKSMIDAFKSLLKFKE